MLYLGHAVAVFSVTGEVPRGTVHPGPWVGAQRAAVRRGLSSMTAGRQALLDEHVPGWRESPPQPPRASWSESAAELRDYVRKTGRFPRQKSEAPDEARVGMWLTNLRTAQRRGELESGPGAARAEWLAEHVPGWEGRGERDAVWQQTARELGTWVGATDAGRWPKIRSADADERRLATWLKNRRDDHRAGRLSRERVVFLDQCAPGWQD